MSISGTKGVRNKAFEGEEQGNVLPTISGSVTNMENNVDRSFLQQENCPEEAEKVALATSHNTEEIALRGVTVSEKYHRLCMCEDDGHLCECKCGVKDTNANIKFESWNRWKTLALIVVTLLVGVWLVVFVTLQRLRVF